MPHTLPLTSLLHVGASLAWNSFTVHWSTVVGLAGLAALYEWAARQASMENGRVPSIFRSRRWYFHSGLLAIFLSLNGWLHDLSDYYLFSAHMVQHLLLTMLVPPLLLAGTPGWMLRPALKTGWIARVARALTGPKACFAIFNLVIIAWHLPSLYNLAMAYHGIHIVQHLMFMVAAVLLWWPILSPLAELPRLSYPLQMLYLFLSSIPMAVVAVYITYSDTLLYPAYAGAPRIAGISPMEDQLIGGLIMWIPGGLVFLAAISLVFFRWQAAGADDSAASAQAGWRPATGGRA